MSRSHFPEFSDRVLRYYLLLATLLMCFTVGDTAQAQSTWVVPAVDLMLIIDNSCSMYEVGNPICGENALGSDPDYLRVTGASLFSARMAFGETQPKDRIGAIHMGTNVQVIYPLLPIEESREALAKAVTNPTPLGGTQVIGALDEAYTILKDESGSGNRPAIVFLTDGVPYPTKNQSFADIEALVNKNSNIPVYMLLLQNQSREVPQDEVERYNAYIGEWQEFSQKVKNVKVYVIPDYDNLLATYHQVIADIAARPYGPPPTTLQEGQEQRFYVSRYARRVYLTVIQLDSQNRGTVEITDKSGQSVVEDQEGVSIFRRPANPVEVYLAYGSRLTGQTDGEWTVRAVNAAVSVYIDVQGAYRFNWLAPEVMPDNLLPGTFMLQDSVNPASDLVLMFNLLIDQQQPVLEPQVISGDLLSPDGTIYSLRIPSDLSPDTQGVYHLPFRLADYSASATTGRFEITLRSDDPLQTGSVRQSVASIRVWVEADTHAPVVTATPVLTATPVISPTATPVITPTATATVTPTPPPPPCSNPPFCKTTEQLIGIGLLIISGALAVVYGLLRLLLKTPPGFVVMYEDGVSRGGKISLKSKGKRKFWQWWKVTVGPKGDIHANPQETSFLSPDDHTTPEANKIIVGDMDLGDLTPAPPAKGGSKKKSRGKRKKRGSVCGEFVYKDGHTRFVNRMVRGSQKLDSTVKTVSLGTNVQLVMCTDAEKLQL